jgi:hypothetical protein
MSKPLDFNMLVFSQRYRPCDLDNLLKPSNYNVDNEYIREIAQEAQNADEKYETADSRPFGQIIEGVSSFLSFVSLVVMVCYWIAAEMASPTTCPRIRLTKEVLLYTNKRDMTDPMRIFQTSYNEYCKSADQKIDIQVPTWDSKNTMLSPAASYGMNINIHAGTVNLFLPALFIYVFAFLFQLARCYQYCWAKNPEGLYKPWLGPDFSRWLEYLFTSPLQIFLVSTAFGFANRDTVLAKCGMQAALVLLGYNIEQHIKKIYKRRPNNFIPRRFHNILSRLHIRDLRGGVYLCLAWSLHGLIWGGIIEKWALLTKQNTSCEANPDSKIPDVVTGILFSQLILFTSFGLVNSIQFLWAVRHGFKEVDKRHSTWSKISRLYGCLSVTSKTLLEIFFLFYVSSYKTWPLDKESVVSHSANYSSWAVRYK